MSRKFYAVDRQTGERWKPSYSHREYLVMYDSGYLAVVHEEPYECWLTPLDPKKWEVIRNGYHNDTQ